MLNLRSKIVHDGEDLTIYSHLSDYAYALYEDLLHDALGMRTHYLGAFALQPGFDFDDLLRPRP
ncbi:hypothetical protein DWG18_06860 [Lysobacter sp. TY2-98]|nr:hypothetical protein DWG18_06860 [Lysobacter sp. TY2-98]